jgi:hypothetical protein
MVSVPAVSDVVVHAAVRDEVTITAAQPEMVFPFEVNVTVPVGTGGPAGTIVAVNVTDPPTVDGFLLETTVVVDAALLTVMEAVPFEAASLAPSPLKHASTLLVPTPSSSLPLTPDNDAVEWQLVVHPLAGFNAEVPNGVPLHAVPE